LEVVFFEAVDLYRTLGLKSNPMDISHFEMNFKRTINCPATRANMIEPSKQRGLTGVFIALRSPVITGALLGA